MACSVPPAAAGGAADWEALHAHAVEAGLEAGRAWRLTPREIVRREADRLTLAWHTARFQRARRLPRLEPLLKGLRQPRRRRGSGAGAVSVDQVATINALLGGRDLRGAGDA